MANALHISNLHTIHERRQKLDKVLAINVFGIQILSIYYGYYCSLISHSETRRLLFVSRQSPSRCVAAENSVCSDLEILRKQIITFGFNNNNNNNNNNLLLQCVLFKYLSIVLFFCLCLSHQSPVYCPLLFVLYMAIRLLTGRINKHELNLIESSLLPPQLPAGPLARLLEFLTVDWMTRDHFPGKNMNFPLHNYTGARGTFCFPPTDAVGYLPFHCTPPTSQLKPSSASHPHYVLNSHSVIILPS